MDKAQREFYLRQQLKAIKEKFEAETSETFDIPGIATGLAVAATGGDILFIEATRRSGKGKLTLRGRVMPIGGAKMKVLAAHRAGLTVVILPQKNLRDLEDLPGEILQAMAFVPVDQIDQALEVALVSEKQRN